MKLIVSILFLVGVVFSAFPQSPAQSKQSGLYYIFKEPKLKSAKPPVIILMHGVGSNEKDLFAFADQLPDSFLVISLRAPITLGNNSYGWYHLRFENGKPVSNVIEAEASRLMIIDFINQLKNKHAYNEKRVYLCGFSQGSIMAYSVGLTVPEKIKGIAVMSGRLLDEVKPIVAKKDKLKTLNVFIAHGTNDHVLLIDNAREAYNYLKQSGIVPTYKEYPEAHTISNAMFVDMLQWLKK
ncbi:MAG: dienelactone hydrolase family protein [Bacteroidetes bacterium]|nr:dienelactone hydrolase family protein [Bacteroidota bacterium]